MPSTDTLARFIVQQGISKINPSMLSDELKTQAFSEAGAIFFREGRWAEAIAAYSFAENSIKLFEIGESMMMQNRVDLAALAFIPTGDRKKIDDAASACARQGFFQIAHDAFVASGNTEMASFIKDNFL